jgi:acyl-CoA synthetase (AMP-forming)/AMP-acid ligase II
MIDGVNGSRYSYDWVRRQTFRIANALHGRGYGIGSKASVLSHNSAESFTVVLSIMRTGMTYIPVNARNTVEHNAHIMQAFDCDVLFFQKNLADSIEAFRKSAPHIREFVCIDGTVDSIPSLMEWMDGYGVGEFDLPHDPERPYEILPTSATTGFPKGVIFPNRQLESILANFMAVAPIDVPPVFLAVAPLTHLAGKFMQYIMAMGGTGVILPNVDKPLILESIPKHRVTHMFLPPTVIYDLLLEPTVRNTDYSSLRYFLYSASPMAPEKVKEAIEVFGPVMCQVWGQSESAWNTILMPADHFQNGDIASPQRLSSCGKPLPFVNVAVMDDEGRLLPPNEKGELVIRGQCVMQGYYNNPTETTEVSQYGWHHTGDVGYRDDEGYFYIVDRKKDMIISGGFNIYSVEVERVVLAHPDVQEGIVIGVPDPKWGEAVKAVVEIKPGATVGPEDIIAWCRQELGAMKSPKSVDIVDALPRSAIGKVLKREVRKWYWGDRERMVS